MGRTSSPSAEEVERASRALDALAAKKAANDAMRKAARDLPPRAAYAVLSRLDRDEGRLLRIVTSLRAEDDRLGLFFRYRYVDGKSLKRVCQYFMIGTSTGARWKARLVELIASRRDIARSIEVWAGEKVSTAQAGRHRPTGA